MLQTCAEHYFHPIGIRQVFDIGCTQYIKRRACTPGIAGTYPVGSAEQMDIRGDIPPSYACIEVDACAFGLPFLGCNQYDTTCSLRAVDSSRTCILQYLDGFHIAHIEVEPGILRYAIYYI